MRKSCRAAEEALKRAYFSCNDPLCLQTHIFAGSQMPPCQIYVNGQFDCILGTFLGHQRLEFKVVCFS